MERTGYSDADHIPDATGVRTSYCYYSNPRLNVIIPPSLQEDSSNVEVALICDQSAYAQGPFRILERIQTNRLHNLPR